MRKITVTAKDETHGYAEALEVFAKELGREVRVEEIKLVEVTEKSGFIGIGKKKEFTFEFNEESSLDEVAVTMDANLHLVQNQDLDGYFQIKVKPDGIFLRVVPPTGKGKSVSFEAIRQTIVLKEFEDVDMQLVERIYKFPDGQPVKIAERKPELDRNADLEVKIVHDKMSAYCTYFPPLGGRKLNLTDGLRKLSEAGVKFGIDEAKLEKLIRDNTRQEILVATGKPAENGTNAQLRYYFEMPDSNRRVKELEDGSVDYMNLDLVVNVRNGDLLVSKVAATPGIPGTNVIGDEVKPVAGKDVRLPKGKNTEIGLDNMSLFATADGQVTMDENRIAILPVFTVAGDVDLETGNIQFFGNVVVKGNVQEGFVVKADGDVEIGGNVGAATVEAGGKVVVHKGFQGKQKGLIKANGDVFIGFIENGHVMTRGNLFVKGAVMHSEIVAKLNVEVEGRGLIVGGIVQAGQDISAKTIGSHLATPTEILAGVDPEIRQQLDTIVVEIEAGEENLDKVVKGLDQLHKIERQIGQLPPDKQIIVNQFEATRQHLTEQLNYLNEQREILSLQLKEQKNGRVKVMEHIYPGVKINIGQAGYRVKDVISHTVFVYDEGDVRTRPL